MLFVMIAIPGRKRWGVRSGVIIEIICEIRKTYGTVAVSSF